MDCAIRDSGSLCTHLNNYYYHIVSNPIFFCKFNFYDLKSEYQSSNPDEIIFEQDNSDKGDTCHFDIKGFKDSLTENFCKKNFVSPNLFVCCNGVIRAIGETDFIDLLNFSCN